MSFVGCLPTNNRYHHIRQIPAISYITGICHFFYKIVQMDGFQGLQSSENRTALFLLLLNFAVSHYLSEENVAPAQGRSHLWEGFLKTDN